MEIFWVGGDPESSGALGPTSKTGNALPGFSTHEVAAAAVGSIVEILELEPGLVLAYAIGF